MHIILLGPPGAGKGTQSDYLRDTYRIPKLATGDILRATAQSDSELGKTVKGIMARGELVPDAVMIDMLRHEIAGELCRTGFILDGFPRTTAQAEALDEMLAECGKQLDAVIELAVNDAEMVSRISGRYACAKCGAGYHDVNKQPKVAGMCDACGSKEFSRREDDKAETVGKRLESYHKMTAPLLPYYSEKGVLKTVDGMAAIDDVTNQIESVLKEAKAA